MTLGEKIKAARKKKGLTQSDLAGNKITRNMLSAIEKGHANPSLETIKHLAGALSVPVAYFLSETDDLSLYEKSLIISDVYRAFGAKNYKACIRKISTVEEPDDELCYILTSSYLELAKTAIARGELITASKYLLLSEENSKKTRLNTDHITPILHMYKCVTDNVHSPLLNFDLSYFASKTTGAYDFEFFKYLILDFDYKFTRDEFKYYIEGKKHLKNHLYSEAVKSFLKAIEATKASGYNAYVLFSIYTDIENCYKQLYDFENAYLYSSKRLSLLEGFKS